ncbi:MAG: DNA polymerase thumb domain-containing protein, partial [bacterium]
QEAKRLCPQAVFLPVRPHKYTYLSAQIMSALEEITPQVYPLSVDEAVLQVTGVLHLYSGGEDLCIKVKEMIRDRFSLSATVALASNPLVAKVAADVAKPDGIQVIYPGAEADFLSPLEVEDMPGVGPATAEQLRKLGIRKLGDLASYDQRILKLYFGKNGPILARAARGEWVGWRSDEKTLASRLDREPEMRFGDSGVYLASEEKSIGHERTFGEDILSRGVLRAWIVLLAEMVARRARRAGKVGRVLVLKLRYHNFVTLHHQCSLEEPTTDEDVLISAGWRLLDEVWQAGKAVRLLGLSLHHLEEETISSRNSLFHWRSPLKLHYLYQALDGLRDRYGENIVGRAMGRYFLQTAA